MGLAMQAVVATLERILGRCGEHYAAIERIALGQEEREDAANHREVLRYDQPSLRVRRLQPAMCPYLRPHPRSCAATLS